MPTAVHRPGSREIPAQLLHEQHHSSAGRARCEAFFVDIKAHVLAHGYVLAGDRFHDVWMLPGDEAALRNHLERYIITEDVVVESLTQGRASFAVPGYDHAGIVWRDDVEPLMWRTADDFDDATLMFAEWDGVPVCLVSVGESEANRMWKMLTSGTRQATDDVFESLRIRERFPIIGRDLFDSHLAPEAGRNTTAISYTKGCYLGQEPVARIDAMGHVNRQLTRFRIGERLNQVEPANAAEVTSEGIDSEGRRIGLAVIRLAGIVDGKSPVRVGNTVFEAEVF
ncbi:MAG: tRNA-modifying protein YgfZ [Planctomycetaceae bacterium]